MTCEHADCHNFPSRMVGKPELNFAAFCQASLPREFYGTVGAAPAVSDRIIGCNPRKNPAQSAT
jgi:hypothetical protein